MSKIDKLAILGVRSFDNTRSETIAFHTPLTLIVGYNGSGKTTIIECLKYATTGDLPPNSKNGAFIHDPKMCGEKEVLAQVKLSFQNTNGAKMVCTRSLQLTVKKTTRTQKTLESQLLILKDGQRSSVSSRCAELDVMLPNFLGVPKAILDAVIFCHQEESMWPLSEPSALKKRFDEIFEAQKYTKAIDNLKSLGKKQKDTLKELTIIQKQYKEDKERSERAERRARSTEKEIEEAREQVQKLTEQIEQTAQEMQRLSSAARSFEHTIAKLNTARENAIKERQFIAELSKDITLLDNTDEELEQIKANYDQRVASAQDTINSKEAERRKLRLDMKTAGTQLNEKANLRGQLQSDSDAHARRLADREELVKKASSRHNVRGFNTGDLDDEQISEFVYKIEKLSRDQNHSYEKAKRESHDAQTAAQNELFEFESRKNKLMDNRDRLRKEVRASEDQIRRLQRELNSHKVDEGEIAILESKLHDVGESISKHRQAITDSNWEEKLRIKTEELREVEQKHANENRELVRGNAQSSSKATLALHKKEAKEKESALESLKNAHSDKINQIVGDDWSLETLEQQYNRTVEARDAEVQSATRVRDGSNADLTTVERELKTLKETAKTKQKARDDSQKLVAQALRDVVGEDDDDPFDYPDKLQFAETNLQNAKSDLASASVRRQQAEKTIEIGRKNKCCRICRRAYDETNPDDMSLLKDFIERMKREAEKASKESAEQEVKECEEKVNALKEVSTDYQNFTRLNNVELPTIQKDLKKLDQRKDSLVVTYNECEKELEEKSNLKIQADGIKNAVLQMSKYAKEIVGHKENIAKISTELEGFGSVRTLEDIQATMQELTEQATRLRQEKEDIQSHRERQNRELAALEKKKQALELELTNTKHLFDKKNSLSKNVEELLEGNKRRSSEMKTSENDIANLQPQIEKHKANHIDLRQQWEKTERDLKATADALSDTVRDLRSIQNAVSSYEARDVPAQLQRVISQSESLQRQSHDCQAKIDEIGDEINEIEKEKSNTDKHKRNLRDNIRLRQFKRELEENEAKIAELESKDAEADYRKFSREHKKQDDRHTQLVAEKATKVGEMAQMDHNLAVMIQEWETDYKYAHKKFHEGQIRVKTTDAAINDLGKYQAALDKAVMKYHALKMEEVNRIVDDLWKRTYKGTDVDTILIRSEQENAKGNRLYNYRVCMVKQDAELDMRGRCSAGQKVLASIIIRLALAECFGTNCGLIALDEPTTNLDRDNSRALAQSLHEIIQYRSAQKNFQLIVITHDEDFLRYMKCNQFTEYYYRVSRNERQKSIIERQSIAEVDR